MNKDWAEQHKMMKATLKKKESFPLGLDILLDLREQLFNTLRTLYSKLDRKDFISMPFPNANGYHNKTIAYSIWHIFRIEDIVVHTLINDDEQIFTMGNYQERIKSPIITTGNELVKYQIADFSGKLDLRELYSYAVEVKESTEGILRNLKDKNLKVKVQDERKQRLESLNVVSADPKSNWLIDYWCDKDIQGLILMPLSRHWIMHIEACLRIARKLHPTLVIA